MKRQIVAMLGALALVCQGANGQTISQSTVQAAASVAPTVQKSANNAKEHVAARPSSRQIRAGNVAYVNPTRRPQGLRNPPHTSPVKVAPLNNGTGPNNSSSNPGNLTGNARPLNYAEASRRCLHESHDATWWKCRFKTIVFVSTGYYYFDAGYWYPAWGYDPRFDNFDYDGPIYTYGNLLPDQVILNVQRALKELGYYAGPLTGSFSRATRGALFAYQQDAGLELTGAIDAPTVATLGLY